jgi:hypothetical protein
MVEFEKAGLPTVSFTSEGFVRDAHRSAENFGLAPLRIAEMRLPFTNQPPESIHQMVDEIIDQVEDGLTTNASANGHKRASEIVRVDEEVLRFDGDDLLGAAEAMNRKFLEYGWSDGFPLIPPTREAVDRMIGGTSRAADDVVAVLEPGFGMATVEKLAVAGVMAGCRPEHLPVLMAAVECLADPNMYIRNKAMSTGPHAPLLVVNGPIRERIGLNHGTCVLGPGAPSYANTVIGRAVRLIMMNIGHTYPSVSDMDTIGSPLKYSLCAAENEGHNPWSTWSVERGFDAGESTVTVEFVYGISELHDLESTVPDRLIKVFATAINNVAMVPTGLWLIGRRADPRYGTEEKEHMVLFICPEHVDIFQGHGWDKARIKQELYKAARVPFSTLSINKVPEAIDIAHPELAWLRDSPETMLPVVEDPDCFDLVVVGGTVGRGSLFHGAGQPVTKVIKD